MAKLFTALSIGMLVFGIAISLPRAFAQTLSPIPADVDQNGCVGIVDFNAWFQAINAGITRQGTFPDINRDGSIDIVDFNLWFKAMLSLPKTSLC